MTIVKIRPVSPADAEAFLRLRRCLDRESDFMMLAPGERATTVDQERQGLQELLASANSLILLAEDHKKLVGYWGLMEAATGGTANPYIVVGLLKAYRGLGLGTRMFTALEEWARQKKYPPPGTDGGG